MLGRRGEGWWSRLRRAEHAQYCHGPDRCRFASRLVRPKKHLRNNRTYHSTNLWYRIWLSSRPGDTNALGRRPKYLVSIVRLVRTIEVCGQYTCRHHIPSDESTGSALRKPEPFGAAVKNSISFMSRPRKAMSEWVVHCEVNQRHIRRSHATREAALKDACSQLLQGHAVNRIVGPQKTITGERVRDWCAKHRP